MGPVRLLLSCRRAYTLPSSWVPAQMLLTLILLISMLWSSESCDNAMRRHIHAHQHSTLNADPPYLILPGLADCAFVLELAHHHQKPKLALLMSLQGRYNPQPVAGSSAHLEMLLCRDHRQHCVFQFCSGCLSRTVVQHYMLPRGIHFHCWVASSWQEAGTIQFSSPPTAQEAACCLASPLQHFHVASVLTSGHPLLNPRDSV